MKQSAHIPLITILAASLCLFAGATEVAGNRDEKGTIYSPIGKRDPFKQPTANLLGRNPASLNPLDQFSIEQLSLRGILRDSSGHARAMFEDPEGKTHILSEGDTVGRERGTEQYSVFRCRPAKYGRDASVALRLQRQWRSGRNERRARLREEHCP